MSRVAIFCVRAIHKNRTGRENKSNCICIAETKVRDENALVRARFSLISGTSSCKFGVVCGAKLSLTLNLPRSKMKTTKTRSFLRVSGRDNRI